MRDSAILIVFPHLHQGPDRSGNTDDSGRKRDANRAARGPNLDVKAMVNREGMQMRGVGGLMRLDGGEWRGERSPRRGAMLRRCCR